MGIYYEIIGGAILTKAEFRRCIIISSIIALIFLIAASIFCVAMFNEYTFVSDDTTHISSGTVADVFFAVGSHQGVGLEMSDGNCFYLVYPWFARGLYKSIGYDIDELSNLLEERSIEYRRMNNHVWIVEIYVDDITIDNTKLTNEQTTATRFGIVIIGIMMAIVIGAIYIGYLKDKYVLYKRGERKRIKKLKRSLKLSKKWLCHSDTH